ncbi:rod shape-determining protein MreC [Teredinibacter sp. KSP-S5-2]|nr:rod shape-determining protein MreC [Teredinibacter sp. KSP-S5-2]WNO11775.1 rod shape-determining protein MreC [Teredinibacter sp. KSP-S5-2]
MALAYIYTDWFDFLKGKAVDYSAPFYWVTDLADEAEDWADNRMMSRARLIQENEQLRTELLVHKRKLQQMASLAAENVRLRELLNSAESLNDRVLITELIGVSPDPMVHKVIVNRGSDHGVYKGQALLDASGLMGQVVEVGNQSAQVLLITDVTHALPVQINRNGVRLIAEGIGDLYQLEINHISNTTDIRVGDLLVSSGLGQRFPVGYPVAEITEIIVDPGRPFVRALARPKAELNRSRHVLLVFDPTLAEQG